MNNTELVIQSLKRRNKKEKIFHFFGITSVIIALSFLVLLLGDITIKAMPAFTQTQITLEVTFDNEKLNIEDATDIKQIRSADFRSIYRESLRAKFPELTSRKDKKELYSMVSNDAEFRLQRLLIDDPSLIGKTQMVTFLADDEVDGILKGSLNIDDEKSIKRIGAKKIAWIQRLEQEKVLTRSFNWTFFTNSDSREPELAGIKGAVIGSIYTLFITKQGLINSIIYLLSARPCADDCQ